MAARLSFYQRMQTLPKSRSIGFLIIAAFLIGGGWMIAQDKDLVGAFYVGLLVGAILGGGLWYVSTRVVASSSQIAKASAGSVRGTVIGVVGAGAFVSLMRVMGVGIDTIMIPFVSVTGAFCLVLALPIMMYGKSRS